MRNKSITKINIGATNIIIVTPLDVFDTSIQEMVDDHYKVVSSIAAIAAQYAKDGQAATRKAIADMKDRGMFKNL
jgi:hypothetical protein